MATKKDLVEAHSFSRRRLVTAFLSGAPGGREVEPSRPGRTIVGGVALSVLLIAGAAIASVLASRTPADWNQTGLIRAQGNDALYAILKKEKNPVLRPIINVTSAQLIFGADKPSTAVSLDTINQQIPGDTIGIYGAPPFLPGSSDLIQSGWTACTGDNLGIQVDVSRASTVKSGTGYAVTVQTEDGTDYLITTGKADGGRHPRARFYEVPDTPGVDDMLVDLGAKPVAQALKVPSEWVQLFEEGGPLTFASFGFDATGPVPAGATGGAALKVSQYRPKDSNDPSQGGVVLTPGGILNLNEFAYVVYTHTVLPGTSSAPSEMPAGADVSQVAGTKNTEENAQWPDTSAANGTPIGQVCAELTTSAGERPAVDLKINPSGSASGADVAPMQKVAKVDPGKGAFYYTGTFQQSISETKFVLTSTGNVYPLDDTKAIENLGYDALSDPRGAPLVPQQWNELFVDGVALSTSAALCPPSQSPQPDNQTCATYEDDSSTSATP